MFGNITATTGTVAGAPNLLALLAGTLAVGTGTLTSRIMDVLGGIGPDDAETDLRTVVVMPYLKQVKVSPFSARGVGAPVPTEGLSSLIVQQYHVTDNSKATKVWEQSVLSGNLPPVKAFTLGEALDAYSGPNASTATLLRRLEAAWDAAKALGTTVTFNAVTYTLDEIFFVVDQPSLTVTVFALGGQIATANFEDEFPELTAGESAAFLDFDDWSYLTLEEITNASSIRPPLE